MLDLSANMNTYLILFYWMQQLEQYFQQQILFAHCRYNFQYIFPLFTQHLFDIIYLYASGS